MSLPRPVTLAVYKDFMKSGRGADRATAALCNALAARGFTVHLLTQQDAATPLSAPLSPAVRLHRLPARRTPFLNKLLLTSALGARLLRRRLPRFDALRRFSETLQAAVRNLRPDLILSTGPNECVELTYAGALPAPILQIFHIYPPVCFAKNKYRRATLLREALRSVAACQVLQPSYRAALRPYADAPAFVIGNGVAWDPDEPPPEPGARQKTIVYIAYFSKDKNQAALIEAFARLRADGWQLHLYGSGTPAQEAQLRRLAETLGVAKRVRFAGLTQTPQAILRQASVCAFPSRTEGFSLALAEAMWEGLPCVGFRDAPGVCEQIEDGVTGLLAAPDVASFAASLQRLVDDAALRQELGAQAAKQVRERHAAERVWEQWEALLLRLLPRPDAP